MTENKSEAAAHFENSATSHSFVQLYTTMRLLLHIPFFLIALVSIQIGFDKSYLLDRQPSQDNNDKVDGYSAGRVDTSSATATIDRLKPGQSYLINVESKGCFHHSDLYLTISRETTGYFASFRMKGKIEGQKVKAKFKKRKLSDFQIDSVRNFERQLILVSTSRYNCTTVDTYTLAVDSLKNTYIDDKCDWQGIGKLVSSLFKKTGKE